MFFTPPLSQLPEENVVHLQALLHILPSKKRCRSMHSHLRTMAFWRGTPSWEISTRVSPHLVLFARNLCKNAFKLMSR